MRKPRCYLSGPMRGYLKDNFPAFNAAAKLLRRAGWEVLNPAEFDKEYPIKQKGRSLAAVRRDYAKRDLLIIINKLRAEKGDIIVVLPGWRKSEGAMAEVRTARWCMIERFTLKRALGE